MPTGAQTGETVESAKEDTSANAEFIESAETVMLNSELGSYRNFPIEPDRRYEEFFKRPFEMYQFSIDDTNTNATRFNAEWPSDNLPPIVQDKLRGVYAFRADITARFIVSSTNMQSGIYRFAAFPLYGDIDHRNWSCTVQGTNYLPHVDFDISCTRRVDLKLPWVFPINATTTSLQPLWRLFVMPIIPLKTGTAIASAACSIWIIHDKFETYGSSAEASFQAGVIDKENKSTGAVSYYLDKFTKSFNALQPVPIIGRYMSYLSTTSSALAKAARVWGFSAPVIHQQSKKVIPYNNRSMAAGDEPVVAHVVGLSTANATPMTKNTGNAYDELSFSYLLSKWWYYKTYQWDDTMTPSTLLASVSLTPTTFVKAYTALGVPASARHSSALAYIANGFHYYKGSIKFKISFAATHFHSGRILVLYKPGSTGAPTDVSMGAYRKILDISEKHSFEMEFPYAETTATLVNSNYGVVYIYVEETLRRPDTVSANADFMIEVAGGDDFRFYGAVGANSRIVGVYPPPAVRNIAYTPQAGCFVETEPFDKATPHVEDDPVYCGEMIRSFRPLMKAETRDVVLKFNSVAFYSASVVSVPGVGNNLLVLPLRPVAVPQSDNTNVSYSSFASRVALGYYGTKGANRLRLLAKSDCCLTAHYTKSDSLLLAASTYSLDSGRTQLIPAGVTNDNAQITQFPYLSELPFHVNVTTSTVTVASREAQVCALSANLTDEGTPVMSYSSVGEDFDCQFFIGWPVLINVASPWDWKDTF